MRRIRGAEELGSAKTSAPVARYLYFALGWSAMYFSEETVKGEEEG
jgi:hypothetical protein